MAVTLSALRTGCALLPRKHYFSASGAHFCQRLSKAQALVRPERLGKLKTINSRHRVSNPRSSDIYFEMSRGSAVAIGTGYDLSREVGVPNPSKAKNFLLRSF
jgi:hypothetical protein